jgi:bacterioferritin-associated ferredoxin
MIVCICRAVSDRQVDQAVAEGAASVEAVSASTGACTDCGSCHRAIENRVQQASARHLGRETRAEVGADQSRT